MRGGLSESIRVGLLYSPTRGKWTKRDLFIEFPQDPLLVLCQGFVRRLGGGGVEHHGNSFWGRLSCRED